jgi:hypothetical protein
MRFADDFLDHPKFVRADRLAPSRAVHLYVGLVSYSKQQRSDGVVPIDMLPQVRGPAARWKMKTLDVLVQVGLVDRIDERTLRVHDFLDWNPSRAYMEARAAARKASANGKKNKLESGARERPDREVIETRSQGDNDPIAKRSQSDGHVVPSEVIDLASRRATAAHGRARGLDIDGDGDRSPQSPPQLALAAEPEKKSGQRRSAGGRLGATECPADFAPNDSTLAKATSLGFSEERELAVREYFIDWWRSKGIRRKDWHATYRCWLRTEAKKLGLKPLRRDEQWKRHQAEMRRATRPLAAHEIAPVPADFESKLGSLFG